MYKNFGLIGNPLSHTISPRIHSIFLNENRINGGYNCFEVKENELPEILDFFKRMKFVGFNITLPYKSKIIEFLDDIDESAKEIGAVNTVKIIDGKLVGFNTDIFGIRETFRFYDVDLKGKRVLVLGAGGATRGLLYELKRYNYKEIVVANRTLNNAEKLIYELKMERTFASSLNFFDNFGKYDIIINSSSAGISGEVCFKNLHCEVFFDMQYSVKGRTLLLEQVVYKNGFDGLVMLIGQAYKAFCIWNDLDFQISYDEIIKML